MQRRLGVLAQRAHRCAIGLCARTQGKVVSTSMNKGVVVAVERLSPHGEYQKRVR
jgi:hypothetical protein